MPRLEKVSVTGNLAMTRQLSPWLVDESRKRSSVSAMRVCVVAPKALGCAMSDVTVGAGRRLMLLDAERA